MTKTEKQASAENLSALVKSKDLQAIKSYLGGAPKEIVLQKDSEGRNALYYAILTGNIAIIKTLIEYGFDPCDIDDKTGATALHIVATKANFDLGVYLLDKLKIDANVLDNKKHNPLYCALMFFNQNDNPGEFSPSPGHMDIAWLLAGKGAKFQQDMNDFQTELEAFERSLLQYIHQGIKEPCAENSEMNFNFIVFLKDALDYYNLFLKDIHRGVPDDNLYCSPTFTKSGLIMPLVFGWQISNWDSQRTKLISLSQKEMKPMIYDLVKISPLLVKSGDTESEPVVLFNNFEASLQDRLKPEDAKQINIMTGPATAFGPGHYFKQTENLINIKDIKRAIAELSDEVDRRKRLSKDKLKNELPIICWIDDLSQIPGKTEIGELQNIAFSGRDVGVCLIAVARAKLSNIIRANFQSIITFHTATTMESKKYTGCSNATELGLDELLFTSPFADGIQPIHIKMEKM